MDKETHLPEEFYRKVEENTSEIIGLLTVASLSNPEVKKARELVLEIAAYLNNYYYYEEKK